MNACMCWLDGLQPKLNFSLGYRRLEKTVLCKQLELYGIDPSARAAAAAAAFTEVIEASIDDESEASSL